MALAQQKISISVASSLTLLFFRVKYSINGTDYLDALANKITMNHIRLFTFKLIRIK